MSYLTIVLSKTLYVLTGPFMLYVWQVSMKGLKTSKWTLYWLYNYMKRTRHDRHLLQGERVSAKRQM